MGLYQNKYRIESTRLKNRDYSEPGSYFVTICTREKICYFGDIIRDNFGKARLWPSTIGQIAYSYWIYIPLHYPLIELDTFVVMPNHIHGIIAKSCFRITRIQISCENIRIRTWYYLCLAGKIL
jgi:REP element-mobilizing transposase RayT